MDPEKEDIKHLLISVGAGHHSPENIPVIKDCIIRCLKEQMSIHNIDVTTKLNLLYVDKTELISYLQKNLKTFF